MKRTPLKQPVIEYDESKNPNSASVPAQELRPNLPKEFAFAESLKGLAWMLPVLGLLVHAVGYGRIEALCSALGFNSDLFEVSTSRYILDGYSAVIWVASNIALLAMTKNFVFTLIGLFAFALTCLWAFVWLEKRFGDKFRARLFQIPKSSRVGSALVIAASITPLGILGIMIVLPIFIAFPLLVGGAVGNEQAKLYVTQPQELIMTRAALPNGELQCSGLLIIANDKNRGWLDVQKKTVCAESADGKFIGKWNLPKKALSWLEP